VWKGRQSPTLETHKPPSQIDTFDSDRPIPLLIQRRGPLIRFRLVQPRVGVVCGPTSSVRVDVGVFGVVGE
jgi:hypothetical protein